MRVLISPPSTRRGVARAQRLHTGPPGAPRRVRHARRTHRCAHSTRTKRPPTLVVVVVPPRVSVGAISGHGTRHDRPRWGRNRPRDHSVRRRPRPHPRPGGSPPCQTLADPCGERRSFGSDGASLRSARGCSVAATPLRGSRRGSQRCTGCCRLAATRNPSAGDGRGDAPGGRVGHCEALDWPCPAVDIRSMGRVLGDRFGRSWVHRDLSCSVDPHGPRLPSGNRYDGPRILPAPRFAVSTAATV